MAIAGGWHGDGVTDPEIKHDNEPCLFCFFFLSFFLSLSLLHLTLLPSSALRQSQIPPCPKKKRKKKNTKS